MSPPDGRLDPRLALLWRAPGTLQVGLDPQRAVAISGVPPELPSLLRGHPAPVEPASRRALDLLNAAGLLLRENPESRWAQAWVQVVGDGPAARAIVAGLREAGVGQVTSAREPRTSGPDLVVVCPAQGRGIEHGEALVGSGVVHLWSCLRDGRALVGPLVVPAGTSCLRCHDLYRTDADAAWPALALAWEQHPAPLHCTAAVSLMASTTVRQALTWLRGTLPATVDATLEEQPDGALVRVTWSVHPGCGCGWGRDDAARSAPDAADAGRLPVHGGSPGRPE